MDPVTYVMVLSSLALLGRGTYQLTEYRISIGFHRLANASFGKEVGGIWYALVGAPLAAWFLTSFFILPLLGLSYNVNIETILTFQNPEAVLIFLFLWLGIAFGMFGGKGLYNRAGAAMRRRRR
jgi:hypothetical protein